MSAGGNFVHNLPPPSILLCKLVFSVSGLLMVLYFIDVVVYMRWLFKLRKHSALPQSLGLQNVPLNDVWVIIESSKHNLTTKAAS